MKTFAVQSGCLPYLCEGTEAACRLDLLQAAELASLVLILQKYHDLQDGDLAE